MFSRLQWLRLHVLCLCQVRGERRNVAGTLTVLCVKREAVHTLAFTYAQSPVFGGRLCTPDRLKAVQPGTATPAGVRAAVRPAGAPSKKLSRLVHMPPIVAARRLCRTSTVWR